MAVRGCRQRESLSINPADHDKTSEARAAGPLPTSGAAAGYFVDSVFPLAISSNTTSMILSTK